MTRKLTIFIIAGFMLFPALVSAKSLILAAGTSKVIDVPGIRNIEYEDASVLSAVVISEKSVLVTGKNPGRTDVLFYTDSGTVAYNVAVSSVVSGRNMIQLDAQILEVAAKSGFDVGVDWNNLLGRSSKTDSNPFVSPLNVSENMRKDAAGDIDTGLLYLRKFSRGQIDLIVDFLLTGNHAKLLAKPKLIAASGKEAQFLSGGEIPVPVSDADGKISIEWKQYGVQLDIKPTLSNDGKYISADITVEVSNVDYNNALTVGVSGSMPAIRSRKAKTAIDIADNETIVIAGLLNTQESEVLSEVPVLSGIPLLGELFKHRSMKEEKTELVIFVTPRLITQ